MKSFYKIMYDDRVELLDAAAIHKTHYTDSCWEIIKPEEKYIWMNENGSIVKKYHQRPADARDGDYKKFKLVPVEEDENSNT